MHDKSTQHRSVQASNRYILLLPFICHSEVATNCDLSRNSVKIKQNS